MSASTVRSVMLEAALIIVAKFNWKIFPARMEDGKKYSFLAADYAPGGENWGMTNDPKQLAKNFNNWKWRHKAGIGIPTGPKNGFFVVEADTPEGHDVDGIAELRRLEAEHGPLPDTLRAESPTGSLHYYFKWPANVKIQNSTGDAAGNGIAPGVDVRGEGGMVVAPPSMKPGGGSYKWLNEGTPIADAPGWLIELATKKGGKAPRPAVPPPDYIVPGEGVSRSTDPKDCYAPVADAGLVAAAMEVIPNPDLGWEEWNKIGMAAWRATEGSDDGFKAFEAWSKKSKKYDAGATHKKWSDYSRSPPTRIGAGSIFYLADDANPDWRSGIEPAEQISISAEPQSIKTQRMATNKPSDFNATPFEWIDPSQIPKRQWLYRPHYIREFLSLLFSSGGKGKSSLLISETLAMVSGRPLLNIDPIKQLRVWYWNGEDPQLELQRRFAAAIKHYGLKPEDIDDRLFIDSGRTLPIVIAEEKRYGAFICEPVISKVVATLRDNQIDVLIIDPFISSHHVAENDNSAIGLVAKKWSQIAEEANCAILVAHHTRKSGGDRATVDDGRGAGALRDAARTARTINTMTELEAEKAEIERREQGYYFRADVGKANLTPPAEYADWFKLVSVDLENSDDGWIGDNNSDHVGVVTPWSYPVADVPKITPFDIARAQTAIKAGGPWRYDQRSKREPWVGIPIAEALGLNPGNKIDRRAVADLVGDWLGAGLLKRVDGRDDHHEARSYVEAGSDPVVPTITGPGE